MATFVKRTWTSQDPATPDLAPNRWENGIEEAILLADPPNGQVGQLLTKTADGNKWTDQGTPTDEQVEEKVTEWLEDHPEATTTVQDNSVTDAKLVQTGGVLQKVSNIYATDADADGNVTLHLGA